MKLKKYHIKLYLCLTMQEHALQPVRCIDRLMNPQIQKQKLGRLTELAGRNPVGGRPLEVLATRRLEGGGCRGHRRAGDRRRGGGCHRRTLARHMGRESE